MIVIGTTSLGSSGEGLVVETFAITVVQDRVAQIEVKPERIIGVGWNLVD